MRGIFFLIGCLVYFEKSKETQGSSDVSNKGSTSPFTWFILQRLTQIGTQLSQIQTMQHDKQGRLSKVEEYVSNLKTKIEDKSNQEYRIVLARIESDLQKLIKQSVKDKADISSLKLSVKKNAKQLQQQKREIANMKLTVNKNFNSLQQRTDGTNYIQWGRTNCTSSKAKLMYSGFVGGSSYSGSGPTNNLCVPNEPQWGIYDNKVNDSPFIGAALFDHWDIDIKNTLFDKKYSYYAIQCAVCDVTHASSTVMIPGRKTCYDNWKMEYTGYLMASHPSHTDLEYICVDGNPDHIKKIPSWSNKSLLFSVYSKCNGATPCPPYVEGREMTCVVCSK